MTTFLNLSSFLFAASKIAICRSLGTIAAVLGHASLTTTAIYTTAIGAEGRDLISRVWM